MRVTITVPDEVISQIDDFASCTSQSRSAVCSALLEMMAPALGPMRDAFLALRSGQGSGAVLSVLDELFVMASESVSEVEKLRSEIAGDGVNPRSCNNGGQVSGLHDSETPQDSDLKGFSSLPDEGLPNA